jgi:hypothetical protein
MIVDASAEPVVEWRALYGEVWVGGECRREQPSSSALWQLDTHERQRVLQEPQTTLDAFVALVLTGASATEPQRLRQDADVMARRPQQLEDHSQQVMLVENAGDRGSATPDPLCALRRARTRITYAAYPAKRDGSGVTRHRWPAPGGL